MYDAYLCNKMYLELHLLMYHVPRGGYHYNDRYFKLIFDICESGRDRTRNLEHQSSTLFSLSLSQTFRKNICYELPIIISLFNQFLVKSQWAC